MRVDAAAGATRAVRADAPNEDAVLELPHIPLYAVVDGPGGPTPARVALEVLARRAEELQTLAGRVLDEPTSSHRLAVTRFFEVVLAEASAAVSAAAIAEQSPHATA